MQPRPNDALCKLADGHHAVDNALHRASALPSGSPRCSTNPSGNGTAWMQTRPAPHGDSPESPRIDLPVQTLPFTQWTRKPRSGYTVLPEAWHESRGA